jgi:hypothetical protein
MVGPLSTDKGHGFIIFLIELQKNYSSRFERLMVCPMSHCGSIPILTVI